MLKVLTPVISVPLTSPCLLSYDEEEMINLVLNFNSYLTWDSHGRGRSWDYKDIRVESGYFILVARTLRRLHVKTRS